MPEIRLSIRDILRASTIPEEDILKVVRAETTPWHGRLLESLRLLLGGDRITAEFCLLHDIADSASSADIEDAFYHYRSDPTRVNRTACRFLAIAPKSSKAIRYLNKLRKSRG